MNLYSNLLSAAIGASLAVLAMLMSADHEKQQQQMVKRVDSYLQPAVQVIKCDRGAVQEVARICRARARMEQVK